MPRKKLSQLKQADGKDYSVAERKGDFNSLDEFFGFHKSQYKTHSEAEYSKSLIEMNKADMQHECVRVGLMPHDNREIMKERLLKEFRRTVTATLNVPKRVSLNVNKKAIDICSQTANKLV